MRSGAACVMEDLLPEIRMNSGIPGYETWGRGGSREIRRAAAASARQAPEQMGAAILLHDGHRHGLALDQLLGERYNLFTKQDTEEPDQRDDRRRRRAHVDKAVDNADEQPRC